MSRAFRINNPPVVAETLDGEATIVDLASGTYYALNESGSFIWDELGRGVEPGRIAKALGSGYGIGEETASSDVEKLVGELSERRLIAPARDDQAPAVEVNGSGPSAGDARAYAPPELSVYTDMQELLLLDPVHEVDESGWPSRP